MEKKELTKKSKRISFLLRHKPEDADLVLDDAGWVATRDLVKAIGVSNTDLQYIVDNNNKKRFEFSNDKRKIRARQGHSVEVKLEYESIEPPDVLFHGTSESSLDDVLADGIKKMNRHHVHLSSDKDTAKTVGSRHGTPVILFVHSGDLYNDGIEFFRTGNGVWLTDFVDPKYIIKLWSLGLEQ